MPRTMIMAGAHSKVREPTDEERAWLTSPEIEQLLQAQAGEVLTTLDPISLTSQVVAGTVYQVKYHTVGWKHVHAKIFRPLPCDNKPPELLGFAAECRVEDPFVF